MHKLKVLLLILILTTVTCTLNNTAHSTQPDFATKTIRIDNTFIQVEIADTYIKKITGLSHRSFLAKNGGMLFVYNRSRILHFTMRETTIPLAIAFIDESGTILEIIQMQALQKKAYSSSQPVKYALEINQGWFKKHGIKPGDQVELNDL